MPFKLSIHGKHARLSMFWTHSFATVAIFCRAGNVVRAAFWYGLAVHFRIYPIVYELPFVLVLDPDTFQSGQEPLLVNWKSSRSCVYWRLYKSLCISLHDLHDVMVICFRSLPPFFLILICFKLKFYIFRLFFICIC